MEVLILSSVLNSAMPFLNSAAASEALVSTPRIRKDREVKLTMARPTMLKIPIPTRSSVRVKPCSLFSLVIICAMPLLPLSFHNRTVFDPVFRAAVRPEYGRSPLLEDR